ncbi:MAG: dihydropteroate synthase [Acidobacteriota bacterium]|nr:dihydropteroate synthase [Acidobacteriota bacterium]
MPAPPATSTAPRSLDLPGGRRLSLGRRPRVMGIVNITPDSFSDGGLWLAPERAVAHGLELLEQGADLLDLGAESTRPGGGVYGDGASEVPAQEEMDRLLPVLEALRRETDAPLSVDTRKGAVARAALNAGADLINDISLLSDDDLARAAGAADCPLVLMHSRGEISEMQKTISFRDLLREVTAELSDAVERAGTLGVRREQIVVDPGIGFGKTYRQNLELIRHAGHFQRELGLPVLLGASRKSFIGHFIAPQAETPPPPARRLAGSLATVAWASRTGAAMVRVHDVGETVDFQRVWHALEDLPAEDLEPSREPGS